MLTLLLAASTALAPLDTLPVPHGYLDALAAGTRSRSGAPGPRYWQQGVSYRITARLHPGQNRVTGSETIQYTNQSPDTLAEIYLNLPQNVFAPGNPRNRSVPVTGGFDLSRVVVQGSPAVLVPRGGMSLSTSERVALAQPLPPGGQAELQIDWSFDVPEGTFRMGREGSSVFYLAQWYPQIAVYDDLRGWVRDPYLGDGEFYQEYGDFDVSITAPAGWLVSASGVLQNPGDVLTPEASKRLRSLTRGGITHIVSAADVTAGKATATGGVDGTLTWRFIAENVRDFAWGSSDEYVWDGTVAEYDDVDGTARSSDIYALYRPDRPNWERAAEFARHSIEAHSYWYPYPYPHMTVNEGVIGGGMEYPMITIVGGGRTPESLYGVVSHEIGHMWWPMVAGSDERNHAWMDEGMASFAEDLAFDDIFPGSDSGLNTMNGYLRIAGTDAETPSMRPADLYGPFGNRGMASYGKPATVMRSLRTILGPDVFDDAMRTYLRRWAFKHPNPLDLFWTYEDVTGQDLDWYFHPWMYTTGTMDQAVTGVEQGRGAATILLEDRGEIPMPAIVEVVTDVGDRARKMMPVSAWNGRTGRMDVPIRGRVVEVIVDPEQRFPDVNRRDNRWTGRR
ncbi:MAG TPA: M1 family metallopeptidase [Longimicrobiales bacterium]|nr:M1 family metallopeptidase [Longimicrobiales bacterium]